VQVEEVRAGPVRWYAFDPAALDWKAAMLALFAALLMLRLQRGLIETVAAMALLGMLSRFIL
jgi:chromate transporter